MTTSTASFRLWAVSAERKREINWVARSKTIMCLLGTAVEAANKGRVAGAKYLIDTSKELFEEGQALPTSSRPIRTIRKTSRGIK